MQAHKQPISASVERIAQSILILRGERVLLDIDLAALYGVETKVLLQAVKRNPERFPADFMLQLTTEGWAALRSQSVTSRSTRGGHRYATYAFTEQGVAMLSSVLNSKHAFTVNIEIMRAFVHMSELDISTYTQIPACLRHPTPAGKEKVVNMNNQQLEAAHVRVLGLLSFLIGWAVKPKNHLEKYYGLRRLAPTYALGNMAWILLLCSLLPVTPTSAHTCNLDASYYHPGGTSNYVFMGTCWSNSDAQAGCREIAASVGHNPNMCHQASRVWAAGWLIGSPTSYLIHLEWTYYFIETSSPPQAEGLSRCENPLVADPVNPSNGATVRTEGDCASLLDASHVPFARYYDSSSTSTSFLGAGWRGSYSRHVAKAALVATPRMHMAGGSPAQSALYDDPSTACTAGFIQIKSRVPNWAGATTQYVDNVCQVIKSGFVISTIAIYTPSNIPLPLPLPNAINYDVTRDDGQLIRFTVINGVITAPPGTSLTLFQTTSGFTVTDGNDNVETYDTSGRLLSITSRAGVVQTMSYDGLGRLSSA